MLKLEDIKKDAQIKGIQSDEVVRVVQVEPVGDAAVTVYYKDSQGKLGEQMLFRDDSGTPLGVPCFRAPENCTRSAGFQRAIGAGGPWRSPCGIYESFFPM